MCVRREICWDCVLSKYDRTGAEEHRPGCESMCLDHFKSFSRVLNYLYAEHIFEHHPCFVSPNCCCCLGHQPCKFRAIWITLTQLLNSFAMLLEYAAKTYQLASHSDCKQEMMQTNIIITEKATRQTTPEWLFDRYLPDVDFPSKIKQFCYAVTLTHGTIFQFIIFIRFAQLYACTATDLQHLCACEILLREVALIGKTINVYFSQMPVCKQAISVQGCYFCLIARHWFITVVHNNFYGFHARTAIICPSRNASMSLYKILTNTSLIQHPIVKFNLRQQNRVYKKIWM